MSNHGKMEGKPIIVKLSSKTLGTVALGAVGALVLGLGMAAMAYPLYLRVERRERERVAPEILRLTEELMQ